MMIKKPRLTA